MHQNWAKSSYLIKTCAYFAEFRIKCFMQQMKYRFCYTYPSSLTKKILLFLGLKNEPKINKTCSNGSYPFTFTTQKSIWFFKLHETIFLVVIKCSFWDTVTNRLNSLTQLIAKKKKFLSVLCDYSHYKDTNGANISISNEKCTIFARFWIK